MTDHDPDIAVVVEGDTLAEAVVSAGVSRHQAVEYEGVVYHSVWPGCASCLFERDQAGNPPLEAPPGEGVYAWDEDDERHFICTGCGREVERQIDPVELLTDRYGPSDTDTTRYLLDAVVGYFHDDVSPDAAKFVRRQWVVNARSVLAYANLLEEEEGTTMKIDDGEGEIL